MATNYPTRPLSIGESAEISGGAQNVVYTIRCVESGLWLVDGLSGIQSEVRDVGSGRYQVLHTNGTTAMNMTFDSWEEALATSF